MSTHDLNPSHAPAIYSKHPSFGWSEDHECVGIEGFDYAAVDAALANDDSPSPVAGCYQDASDGLREILTWTCQPKKTKSKLIRFVALVAALRPELMDDRTYAGIGRELGVSKAGICKAVMLVESHFGFKTTRTRSASGREAMRKARLAQLPAKR